MALRRSNLLFKQCCISSNSLISYMNGDLINSVRNIHFSRTLFLITPEKNKVPNEVATKTVPVSNFFKFDEEMKKTLKRTFSPPVPTHSDTLSNYISHSKTLQALALLKVELFTIEKFYPETLQYLVKLDLKMDIKPKLDFLLQNKVSMKGLGSVLTKYPMLLDPKRKIEDMQEIVNYLDSKKFNKEQISSLITRLPSIFHFPVPKLDGMLGFYQRLPTNYETNVITFKGNSLRNLVLKCPQLLQQDTQDIFMTIKFLQMSCGFTVPEIRQMISDRPNTLIQDTEKIELLYKFLTREMEIENDLISKSAFVFGSRIGILESRHFYLKSLGRNKYKVDEPGYLSLFDVVCSNDRDFCHNCETGTLQHFENFMKTM